VGSVRQVSENPLKEGDQYLHLSPMIERYLKFMNIVSNNYIADQTFDKLGGEKGFDEYFSKIAQEMDPEHKNVRVGYSSDEGTVKMFTGSGLNTTRSGSRVDNFGNCAMITLMVERLNNILTRDQIHLSKIVAVPGSDGGTFRSRLKSPRLNKTFVAKTGTLYHTSALSGVFFGDNTNISFGIFHQLTGWKGNAKMVQNQTVSAIFDAFKISNKFDYKAQYFFPAKDPIEKVNE
ncbi:MAG: D-alanyl-D-alanine carboxypeptidase, partial [Halobacteriovoraceae bacterium]|nr:D-alanyl-D-alanine carboxypeptidase [Halobacteriovoraceae bacterium]